MIKAKNYQEYLLKQLQDPDEAAAYLNAALRDKDPDVFRLALHDIALARQRAIQLKDKIDR